jgi:hypothetical protein
MDLGKSGGVGEARTDLQLDVTALAVAPESCDGLRMDSIVFNLVVSTINSQKNQL